MTIRNLSALLHPKSIAIVGASAQPGTLGALVLRNVLAGGFAGQVHAVNPHRVDVAGALWARSVSDLPEAPDLAVVATPAASVPAIIADLGALGTKCVVVLSAGMTAGNGLRQAMLDAARPHLLRVVGPNCLGVMAPHAALDATFARTPARPGRLALISQSGALVTAILDWAENRGIGFSGIVSAGDMADVDLGDLIDLFAVDSATDAILLYVEGVTDAAKFMSAARAAACNKPVIAIKAGRSPQAAKAAFSHTGALAGSYDVYRTAFDRAGIVTVDSLTELFDAAEILCAYRHVHGGRLGIVTNGGGAGILAVDALGAAGATLAELSPMTMSELDAALPANWSRGDPVDVIGDAGPERYRAAIGAVLRDEGVDALLVMNCPTASAEADDIASALVDQVHQARRAGSAKPVLACWLGDANAAAVRERLAAAGVPVYDTPDGAVRGFGYLLAAKRAREALVDAPARSRDLAPDIEAAKAVIAEARAESREALSEIEAKQLLAAYAIPTVPTRLAASLDAVEAACDAVPAPYALKIVSPDISHKSDVGGVVLDLPDRQAVLAAATEMTRRLADEHPEARIAGYAVEAMCRRPHAHELIAGIATDPTFGPLLMVGAGGTAVEILADKALALPPVDDVQAHAMIAAMRVSKLLAGFRNEPPADLDAVAGVISALSTMVVDLPDILELDINPLLVGPKGVVALDARVAITRPAMTRPPLAIRPAPVAWSADLTTRSGFAFHVRPVRADDEPLLAEFFAHVTPEDLRFRFMTGLTKVDHEQLAMMTRVDYRRTISFLAFDKDGKRVIATAMLAADPDRSRAEVALTTRTDMKGCGISWTLFDYVLRYAEAERIPVVEAIEFADHDAAIRMEREMGFTVHVDPDDPTLRIIRRTFKFSPKRGVS